MQDLRRNKDSFGVPKECLSDAIITGMVSIRLVASQIPNRTNGFANMCVCVCQQGCVTHPILHPNTETGTLRGWILRTM